MKAFVGGEPQLELLRRVEIFKVMQPRSNVCGRPSAIEHPETEQRLFSGPAGVQSAADVPARGEDERVRAEHAVCGSRRDDAVSSRLDECDLPRHRAEADRLLQAPSMRR